MGMIDGDQEKDLVFVARVNLTLSLLRAGEVESAAKELASVRQLNRYIDNPLGTIKLDWIEGDLEEIKGNLARARTLYEEVRTQYGDAEQLRDLGIVSVDLMTIHSHLGEWQKVKELAVPTLPLLTAMQLHSETVAAVELLAEAVRAGGLSRRIVKDLRGALRQDPLAVM